MCACAAGRYLSPIALAAARATTSEAGARVDRQLHSGTTHRTSSLLWSLVETWRTASGGCASLKGGPLGERGACSLEAALRGT